VTHEFLGSNYTKTLKKEIVMTTTVDYSNIDQNRPASWKQKKAVNTRLSDILAKWLKVDIAAVRPIIGSLVTNQPSLTHGEVQKYFSITKVTQVDKDLKAAVKEAIENPESIKAAPKKRAARKTESSQILEQLLAGQKIMLEEFHDIKDRVSQLEDSQLTK